MKLHTIICHEPWHVFLGVPLDGNLHNSALVSKLWVHTLHMCSVSQNLILFARGFPGFRVWVWSRGPHLVCKEYFASFTWESVGWVLRKPTTQTETQPCCPLRTLNPCISWARCLGKGRACFSAKFPHLVRWLPLLLLARSSANVLQEWLGGHPQSNSTRRFYKGFFPIFPCPVWDVLCTGEREEDTPKQFISWPRWHPGLASDADAMFQGRRDGGARKLTTESHRRRALLAAPAAHARPRWRLLSWLVHGVSLKKAGEGASLALSASGSCVHISFCPSLSLSFIFHPVEALSTCSGFSNS